MTPGHKLHLERIIKEFSGRCALKYERGQEEHGGDLWLKDGLLDMAIEEVIDLVTYLLTLRQQKKDLKYTRGQVLNFDMDNTVCHGVCFTPEECERAEPRLDTIEKINELSLNHFIIVYTARRDHLIPATLEWLRRHGVRYHAISNIKIPGLYIDEDGMVPNIL